MLNTELFHQHAIPYYKTINGFLEAAQFVQRTKNPYFFAVRLEETYPDVRTVMPPFRKEFYLVALVRNQGRESEFLVDQHHFNAPKYYLVFQSPGHVLSWKRDEGLEGYLLYFKEDCFSFFRNSLSQEFEFFDLLHANFFGIKSVLFDELQPDFENLIQEQESDNPFKDQIIYSKLLATLYKCKAFYRQFTENQRNQSAANVLTNSFQQLINNYYLSKRTVDEYADLLHITPNHLNDSVKKVTGRNAYTFITDKLLNEAKNLLQFTSLDVTEIAYQLNFSGPTHFGKFFRKHTESTPLKFRQELLQR